MKTHIHAMIDAVKCAKINYHVDHSIQKQVENLANYGPNLVKHLVCAVTLLTERRLAFELMIKLLGLPTMVIILVF